MCSILNARPIAAITSDPTNPFLLSPSTLLTQRTSVYIHPFMDLNPTDMCNEQWRRENFLPNVSGNAGSKSTCTLYNLEESGNMTKLTWTPVSLSCWKIPRNTDTTGRLEWWKMLSVEKMIAFEKQRYASPRMACQRFIQDPWPNLFCFWVSTEIIKTPLTVTE